MNSVVYEPTMIKTIVLCALSMFVAELICQLWPSLKREYVWFLAGLFYSILVDEIRSCSKKRSGANRYNDSNSHFGVGGINE